MAKSRKISGIYPAPVYVAIFSDGTVARMSYCSPVGKSLRQSEARRMVCQAIANERERHIEPGSAEYFESNEYRRTLRAFATRLVNVCLRELALENERYAGIAEFNTNIVLFRSQLPHVSPASDIIAGHTYRKDTDEIVPDPFFVPDNVLPMPKPKRRTAAADLARAVALLTRVSASLSGGDLNAVQQFIAERAA